MCIVSFYINILLIVTYFFIYAYIISIHTYVYSRCKKENMQIAPWQAILTPITPLYLDGSYTSKVNHAPNFDVRQTLVPWKPQRIPTKNDRMLKEFAPPPPPWKRWGRNPHLQVNLSANLHNLCNGDIDHFSRWEKSSLDLGWNTVWLEPTEHTKENGLLLPHQIICILEEFWISLACNFEDLKDRQTT